MDRMGKIFYIENKLLLYIILIYLFTVIQIAFYIHIF